MVGHRSRRADRAPGRCRAGGGLLGGKGPAGRFVWFQDFLQSRLREPVVQVVLAGRGEMIEAPGQRVEVETPEVVDPTNNPFAGAPIVTPGGGDLGDGSAFGAERRCGLVVDAAEGAVVAYGGIE